MPRNPRTIKRAVTPPVGGPTFGSSHSLNSVSLSLLPSLLVFFTVPHTSVNVRIVAMRFIRGGRIVLGLLLLFSWETFGLEGYHPLAVDDLLISEQ